MLQVVRYVKKQVISGLRKKFTQNSLHTNKRSQNDVSSSTFIHRQCIITILLRPDINEEIEIFVSPTVKSKSDIADRPICSRPGCTSLVRSRGLCYTHRYPCTIDGCEKQVKIEGYCREHAKEFNPKAHDRLRNNRSCCVEGCNKHARVGGYCTKHAKEHDPDAYNRLRDNSGCKVKGCPKHAQTGGYCIEHSKQYDPEAYDKYVADTSCKVKGCNKQAKAGGYCAEHAQNYAQEAYKDYCLRVNKSQTDRYNYDVDFKLARKITNYIKETLKRASKPDTGKVKKYLGCTGTQLRQYFEQNHFQEEGNEWMSWDNHGGERCHNNQSWEVDHIMPKSSFDLTDEEEVRRVNHWSNLQPLEWQENAGKYDSIPKDFEWCSVNERWLWSEASGKMNYELPQV